MLRWDSVVKRKKITGRRNPSKHKCQNKHYILNPGSCFFSLTYLSCRSALCLLTLYCSPWQCHNGKGMCRWGMGGPQLSGSPQMSPPNSMCALGRGEWCHPFSQEVMYCQSMKILYGNISDAKRMQLHHTQMKLMMIWIKLMMMYIWMKLNHEF